MKQTKIEKAFISKQLYHQTANFPKQKRKTYQVEIQIKH